MASNNSIERPKEVQDLANAFAEATNFVDDHLQEFRYGIYGLFAVGTILTVRSLKLFTRFKKANDLPKKYLKNNITLHGIVRRVDPETRALLVEHEPRFTLWKRKIGDDSLLSVSLGGIRTSTLGYQWLDLTVRNQRVDFTLLGVSANNEAESIVKSTEGILKKRCLNSEAVKLGFAQVADIDKRLSSNKTYMKLYRELLQMEAKALNSRNGVWATTSTTNQYLTYINKLWTTVMYILRMVPKTTNLLIRKT